MFSKFDLGVMNYPQHLNRVSEVIAGGNFSLSKGTIMLHTAAAAIKAMQENSKSCKNLFWSVERKSTCKFTIHFDVKGYCSWQNLR